jgi:WD40 repeat protein
VTDADAGQRAPYVGLAHFTEERADIFFGRDSERGLIIGNLRAARLTLLYAQSGVGKSSLLRAGVTARLNALAQRSLTERGTPGYIPVVFSSWQDEPAEQFLVALRTAIAQFAPKPLADLHPDSLATAISLYADAANATLLIILDQFEEYLLYSSRETHRHRFAAELAACLNRADLRANFLIAVREDAYAGLGDLFAGQVPNLYANYLHLEYLDRRAAREAILRPIDHFNATCAPDEPIDVEPALVEAVLDQVQTGRVRFAHEGRGGRSADPSAAGGARIETPYLQLVMRAVWDRERAESSNVLRLSTLAALGGAERIVHSHLEDAMRKLTPGQRDTAAEVFDHLVTPSGAKIAHSIPDLAGYSGRDPSEVEALVDRLTAGDQRILRPIPAAPGADEHPKVEIFHDVLAPAILAWRSGETAARLERDKQAAERRAISERRRARRFRALAGVSLVLFAAAIVAALIARHEQSSVVRARNGELSRQLAANASSDLQGGPIDRGALLSIEAYRYQDTEEARTSLAEATQSTTQMVGILGGHNGDVTGVSYSPDGTLIASAGVDGTIRVQETATGRTVRLLHAAGSLRSIAFSPNGRLIAGGSEGGYVTVWNTRTGRSLGRRRADAQSVNTVAFDSSGKVLASAGNDGEIMLWTLAGGSRRVLMGSGARINSIAFASGDAMLAAGDDDGYVTLWNASTGRRQMTLSDGAPVNAVAFAPDGRTLAAGDGNSKVTVWNARTGRRLMALSGSDAVNAIAYSPDGALLASGGEDKTVTVWNLRTGQKIDIFAGHFANVETVAFAPSGHVLASGADDGRVILWRVDSPVSERTLARASALTSVAFSPDGKVLAAGTASGKIVLWDPSTGHLIRVLDGRGGVVEHVAFSPDGHTLAVANAGGTVTLWNPATGALERALPGHNNIVYAVAFSPNGRVVASGSADGTVTLWNPATGAKERTLRAQDDFIYSVAFSPDGRTLASGSQNATVVLWDVSSGRRLHTLSGHNGAVESVAFSPSGRLLASGSDDRTVILWNTRTGQPVGDPLAGAAGSVLAVAFSPNGTRLVATGEGPTAMLWDLSSRLAEGVAVHARPTEGVAFSPNGETLATASLDGTVQLTSSLPRRVTFPMVRAQLCGVVRRNLSQSEWRTFLPGQRPRATCANRGS